MANSPADQALAAAAAAAYNLSPQTIWGVYGTETTFGANTNTSTAGAIGPMQFEPATWSQYGDGIPTDVYKTGPAMLAAAKYLAALGATNDPKSSATVRALNNYNGNGGGTSSSTSYVQSVFSYGGQYLGTGGVAGLGGRGTSPNDRSNSAFTVGDSANPNEDYWTAINRLSQDRYWYCFSDSETLYLADGPDLMAQDPVLTLDRWGDRSKIMHLDFTYDNTAFAYATNHKKRARIQRKSTLAKVTSPVMANLLVICDIDEVRAGDVVKLSGCGPGDGKWLVGDTRRSVFAIYSELTLVPALSPLSEQQVAGAGSNTLKGPAASAPGSGTVIAAMISAAATINNQKLPYVWGGGHAQVGTPNVGSPGGPGYDGHSAGYDCSSSVAAVLKAGGLWTASSVGNDASVISTLRSAGLIIPGQGHGTPECTLFDNPGSHIYMKLNNAYFGSWAGTLPSNGAGIGWCNNGYPLPGYQAWHFPQALLSVPKP